MPLHRGGASTIWLLAFLCTLAASGVIGWRMYSKLRLMQADQVRLEQHRTVAEQQLKDLAQQHAELEQSHQQLTVDRDNLLGQTKRAMQERDQAEAERQLLGQVFPQAAAERLDFERRLLSLQEQYGAVLQQEEALQRERDALQGDLAASKSHMEEKRLKDQLAQEQRERQNTSASWRQAQQEASRLRSEREHAAQELAALQRRHESLEDKYAKALGDNKSLRTQAERIPGDVEKLAREHARLLQELADTHYNMGVMFSKHQDFARAATEFQKVIELAPDDPDAHYNLGVIYAEHLPDRPKAMSFFRKYLAVSPRNTPAASYAKQYIATWQAWEAKDRLE